MKAPALGLVAYTLFVAAVYLANGRSIGYEDADPANYVPIAIVRGDGPYLDRFVGVYGVHGENAYSVGESSGHLVSRYPLAPALAALPLTWLQMAFLDRMRPEWEATDPVFYAHFMGKVSQAVLSACLGGVLLAIVSRFRLRRTSAFLAASAGALGSTLWIVASQGPWQHGIAALGLAVAILLLWDSGATTWHLLLAGLACATMIAARSIDAVFGLALTGYAVAEHRKRAAGFIIFPVVICSGVAAYNYVIFGALEGGQAHLEALHPAMHHVVGTWTGNVVEGVLGTLISPSRGLFVFSPWVAVALLYLPATGFAAIPPVVRWLLAALPIYAFVLSKYSVWWGGWSFGPRFWTDTIPIFVVLLAEALEWASRRRWPLQMLPILAIVVAIDIQVIGALAYPCTWNAVPVSVDVAHERLWDWRDSEIARCLRDGRHRSDMWFWSR